MIEAPPHAVGILPYKITALETVTPSAPRWLMQGRIPFGGITMIAGRPGEGKSQFTLWLAAQAAQQGMNTLMIGIEDGIEDMIVPRLLAHRCDLAHVKTMDMESGIILPENVPSLRHAVQEHGFNLVVIDPIISHLSPDLSANSDQSLRIALKPVAKMARDLGVAVVCVTHLRKSKEGAAMDRIGGSIGFGGIARSAFMFGRSAKDDAFQQAEWRYLVHVKCNGARLAPTVSCRLADRLVDFGGRTIATSSIVPFEDDPRVTAEDLS